MLRLLKDAFGIIFKIKEDRDIEPLLPNPNHLTKKRTVDETSTIDELQDSSIYENNESDELNIDDDASATRVLTSSLRSTVLLSCYGIGYSNIYRRIT